MYFPSMWNGTVIRSKCTNAYENNLMHAPVWMEAMEVCVCGMRFVMKQGTIHASRTYITEMYMNSIS